MSLILPLFAKPNLGLHFPVSFVEFFSYIGLNATAKKECIPPPVTYQQAKSQPKDRKNYQPREGSAFADLEQKIKKAALTI